MIAQAIDCDSVEEQVDAYLDQALAKNEKSALETHLQQCDACREMVRCARAVKGAIDFAQIEPLEPAGAAVEAEQKGSILDAAPWWAVSTLLHVLIIALAGLITMAIELPKTDESLVMVTELTERKELNVQAEEKQPSRLENPLASKHDTPPTDPVSNVASDIVVPPDILAKAEIGDHFETINPDRPDTHSAFGNPDAHMFHSIQGNNEEPGGGGVGGTGLDDLIGVGGAGSPGTGGGWGGGSGTGTGIDSGSGHGSFGNRNGGGRRLMVMRHGGSKATEDTVDKALEWLAYHQENDGHWDIKKYEGGKMEGGGSAFDESITGLATLAFLGAGHTTLVGKYRDNVKRACEWMIAHQQADGRFSPKRTCDYDQYDLAICTLALAEAHGMCAGRDAKIQQAAQKGVDAIVACQQPSGAWNHSGGGDGSMSLFGWMIMALKSAKIAGLKFPLTVFENGIKHIDNVSEKDDGGYYGVVGYTRKGFWWFGKLNMTAVGMTSLQFMGLGAETVQQADMIAKHPPEWRVGPVATIGGQIDPPQNFYHWYYATLGLFQAGGQNWTTWNEALKKTLIPNQIKAGDNAGSWDPVTTWDGPGGRVYTTAMGALCLEVYYRYMKLKGN